MKKYGYGAREESLYLQAYEFAKSGHPTLLFSFESARNKLVTSLISHILKIEVDEIDLTDKNLINEFNQHLEALPARLRYIDTASMSLEEISNTIGRNKAAHKITHVVLDRVNDTNEIERVASKLGVSIFY